MHLLILASIFLFLVLGGVTAAKSEREIKNKERWIHSHLIDDYSTCNAFYHLTDRKKNELDKALTPLILKSKLALQKAQETKLSDKDMDQLLGDRHDTATYNILRELRYSLYNAPSDLSRVKDKYQSFCEELKKNPEKRMKYWSKAYGTIEEGTFKDGKHIGK